MDSNLIEGLIHIYMKSTDPGIKGIVHELLGKYGIEIDVGTEGIAWNVKTEGYIGKES